MGGGAQTGVRTGVQLWWVGGREGLGIFMRGNKYNFWRQGALRSLSQVIVVKMEVK